MQLSDRKLTNKISFIYFDCGGVLFSYNRYFEDVANTFNVSRDDVVQVFTKNAKSITKGHMHPDDLWEIIRKELHIANGEEFDFLSSWISGYDPIPQVHDLVKDLHKQYSIGLLTNIYKGMLSIDMLYARGIIPNICYSSVVASCDVGYMKPEKEIYKIAEKKARKKPYEILYVDDKEEFLNSARKRGWNCMLFDSKNYKGSIKKIRSML